MASPKLLPIGFSESVNLSTLNVAPADVVFKNVSIQSGKYVTVREESKGQVAIIDVAAKTVLRLPVQVDSAIMNPISKVIALRAGNNLQIYNLEMKAKMKTTTMDETVVYWKWLDQKTIAIVTEKAAYHWSMDGEAVPTKMFDRAAHESPVQIINYRASADGKWLLLGGIAASSAGTVEGVLQVFSVDLKASQPKMDAHTACFAQVTLDGRDKPSQLFCFTMRTAAGPKLNIIEVGVPKESAFNKSAAMAYDDKDFPVAMLPDNNHGSLFVLTKAGMLFLYEIQSGKSVFANKVSANTMFASIEIEGPEGGILTVDQTGRVAKFFVDEKNIVPYICNVMNDYDLGVQMARRNNLPGAEGIFKQQFQRLIQSQRYDEAMELAASSPQGVLRNMETIQILKSTDGGKALLQYFQALLKKGQLNSIESIELSKLVLAKGGIDHIKGWLKEQKLAASEELGDILRSQNVQLALSVYLRANVPEKVIGCFLSLGAQESETEKANEHFRNILAYAQRVNFTPDYPILVQQLCRVNSERAKDFAVLLLQHSDGPKLDLNGTVDTFIHMGDIKSATSILLEYLKSRGDNEADAALQTKLLEINLLHSPQVADAIFESSDYKFTHYDHLRIAQLCERAQLYQRALEHYTDLTDIKRVLTSAASAQMLNPEFVLEYFGRMTPSNCLECLRDLLKYNLAQNIRLVVEVAKKWSDHLTPEALVSMFEDFKAYNGIFYYLGSMVNFTENQTVVFKYIEAAVKLDQVKEVERIARDNNHYDPKQVKEFLLSQNLKDPRPLIHVCDRFDYVEELTAYLYNKNMFMFIEAYVQRMNAKATPAVLGALLDLNSPDDQISKLLSNVRPPVDDKQWFERLVEQVEKRNRLKLLKPYLEARATEGSQEVHVHNGLAKIYIETNNNAANFLTNNKFYDSAVVGAFAESRDPHLAFIAYKRAWGGCDDQLVAVCNKNGFFKDLARYLVERQDLDLWAKVLQEDNPYRRQLIDQVVATALPESRLPEEVSTTVKAFMAANLPNELMELLERIILHGPSDGEFQSNKNLQNLLILTAIKADKKRVMDYVKRLNNYDGPDIAKIALSDQYKLYEEAFFIYKKFKKGPEAIGVLLENIDSMERAVEFAEYWNQPDVWSLLGKAQLDRLMVKECIACFLKADDATFYLDVIRASKGGDKYEDLILYLKMARTKVKDVIVDNELIYSYAKTNKLAELEDFLSTSTQAKIQDVGDLCFAEGLFEAARILFNHVGNNAKLAICLVRLQRYAEAVEAARKANNVLTWKEVCFACVIAKEFRLAQICAMNVIVYMDHMLDLVKHYERLGYFQELIAVLEQGINLDRAHQGMYTQLGVCYAKYKEEKLMEHIKLFWSRLNIPTLLVACQQNLHWNEAVFLYTHYDQYDNAIDVLITHSAECWEHKLFKEVVLQVGNTEIYYRAIRFYLSEHPLLLNDLLLDLAGHLDHHRVVDILTNAEHLPLIEKYLLHVQRENIPSINEAVNSLFVRQEEYRKLRDSVDAYKNFDQIALAQQLEMHELMEMRRIAAHLYRVNKRHERAIDLSKKDELWQDAADTAADSQDASLAESLVYFFVEKKLYEVFAAALYTCYELIRPDVVLELSWRNGLMDFAMPFFIQTFREYDEKMKYVHSWIEKKDKEMEAKENEEKKKKEEHQAADTAGFMPMLPMAAPMLALPPAPGFIPAVPGVYGAPGYAPY